MSYCVYSVLTLFTFFQLSAYIKGDEGCFSLNLFFQSDEFHPSGSGNVKCFPLHKGRLSRKLTNE